MTSCIKKELSVPHEERREKMRIYFDQLSDNQE
jgi:hypothetical protein